MNFLWSDVGSIHEMSLIHDNHRDIRSDLTPEEQLDEIAKHVRPLYELRDKILQKYPETKRQEDQTLSDRGIRKRGKEKIKDIL